MEGGVAKDFDVVGVFAEYFDFVVGDAVDGFGGLLEEGVDALADELEVFARFGAVSVVFIKL